jgi:putative spermidine/putrescine transport system permease protein
MRRAVGLTALLVGLLLPLVPLLLWAVSGEWRYPALVPQRFSLRAVRLLGSPETEVVRGLVTSATIAVCVAAIAAVVGLTAGRALGLYAFRGKRLVQFLVLAPVIVPGLAVTLGIQVLFIRYRIADTVPGVVLVHLIPTVPYVTYVMASVYSTYDVSFEDQARVLGASPLQVLRWVTLPAVFPGLAVAALFAFLISWSEYILTLLVGGGTVKTLPLLLFAFLGSSDLSVAAALSLAFLLPPVVLLVLTSRYLSGNRGQALVGFSRL